MDISWRTAWRNRLGIILVFAAMVGGIAFFALQLGDSHQREQEFAFRDNENLTRVLERHLAETFAKIDVALILTVHRHAADIAAGNPGRSDINAALAETLALIPESQSLRIVDAGGTVIYDASGTPPAGNVADRAYFRRNRDDPRAGLVISEPIFARFTKNWVVTVSRRLTDGGGRFIGLVQAAIRADYFENFYKTLDVGRLGTIALFNRDLLLVAQHPARPDFLGKPAADSGFAARLAASQNSGSYVAPSPVDGVERSYSYRALPAQPFVVVVGRSQDEIFADWRRRSLIFLAAAAALLLSFALTVRSSRRDHARALALAGTMSANWQETLQRTRALLDSLPDPAWLKDRDGRLVAINDAYRRWADQPAAALIGRTDFDIWPEREARSYWQMDAAVLAQQQQLHSEGTLAGADGERRHFEFIRTPVRDDGGRIIGIAGVARDLTERKRAEDRIRHMADHDPLTDLPNRLQLSHRLAATMAESVGDRLQIALLFLDLDHFKNINDSLGHDVGDKLLVQVAQRLRRCLHDKDTVSRQGGDEFVILLVHCTSATVAAHIAQRLIDAVARPFHVEGHEFCLSASIGIAVYPQDGNDIGTLLKSADLAMYHAKNAGRGRYQFFTAEMNRRISERLALENSLRKALARGEFELHYQPQVDAASGRLAGVEALIRWRHPELGMVPPGRFIPIAEDTNLILPIGHWVLAEACRQNRAWQDQGLPPVKVAVNLSALQFRQRHLVRDVAAVLAASSLDPAWLELEITEGTLMSETERVSAVLGELKALGVGLAIDDFGTGYSSLSYLKRFPIDTIKIDQAFVRDVHRDPDNAAIACAIIGIAASLRLGVVAEGVESREELDFLAAHHCPHMQGYYFSRPVPAEAIAAMLAETPNREAHTAVADTAMR